MVDSEGRHREPRTWIVGTADDSGLVTECLLALTERFELPDSVAIAHGSARRRAAAGDAPANVLAFVHRPEAAGRLLRAGEAAALVVAADRRDEGRAPARVAAVALDRSHPAPIDQAVRLAVTTLIDWGHPVVCRRTHGAPGDGGLGSRE